MKDGGCMFKSAATIDRGSASITAGVRSGHLAGLGSKVSIRFLIFQTGWLTYWVLSF